MKKLIGGWSMALDVAPLDEFDITMYGMVTNLEGLTTGSRAAPGWSPANNHKPFAEKTSSGLWVYGGGGCSPVGRPSSDGEVQRIIDVTVQQQWDGVDFDDECNMDTDRVIQAMAGLKANNKQTSYGFISGYSYNHPQSVTGQKLAEKVKKIIQSGHCDRLIHYCYASAMWSESDIKNNVRQALQTSLDYGMPKAGIILALTTRGLNDWSLNYFLDQIVTLDVGGLFVWRYTALTDAQRTVIKNRLSDTLTGSSY